MKKFIKKWGTGVLHDQYMKPIIPPVYKKSINIINSNPQLEIYADDVACSHGSTSGAIDEDALFYLTSRGISKPVAIDMLTMAFLAEAVDEIDNYNLKDVILELLSGWLERRR